MKKLQQRIRSEEAGFGLPEMLVASMITLIIAVAAMALMLTSFRQSDNQSDRIVALDNARNGMLKMVAEIRNASALESINQQVLDILVHFPEDTANPYHWIRYKCVGNDQGNSQGLGGTCSRQDKDLHGPDCASSGTGPGCTVIIRDVVKYGVDPFAQPCENDDGTTTTEKNFCKKSRTVQLSIFVDVEGAENPIELRSAATIRNCLQNQTPIPCVTSS